MKYTRNVTILFNIATSKRNSYGLRSHVCFHSNVTFEDTARPLAIKLSLPPWHARHCGKSVFCNQNTDHLKSLRSKCSLVEQVQKRPRVPSSRVPQETFCRLAPDTPRVAYPSYTKYGPCQQYFENRIRLPHGRRMQSYVIHWGIKNAGREPSWCRLNPEYH